MRSKMFVLRVACVAFTSLVVIPGCCTPCAINGILAIGAAVLGLGGLLQQPAAQ